MTLDSQAFKALIIKMIDNEIAMSRLYRQYAVSFPEDASLWNGLCYQELSHAETIMQLNQWIQEGKITKGMTSLTQPAVTASIDFINSVRLKCEQGGLQKIKAYALAFDIENSLIEKRFFSVFALEQPEVLEIMASLILETEGHREKIGQVMRGALAEQKGISHMEAV